MDGVLGGPLSSALPLDKYLRMALEGDLPTCPRAMAGVHLSQYKHLERRHLHLNQSLSDAFIVLGRKKKRKRKKGRSFQGIVCLSQW